MSRTTVVNLRASPYTTYIGRGSIWGNPYRIGPDGTRDEVIALYAAYLDSDPDLLDALPSLKGEVLGCFCVPLPCHGDVLVERANRDFR